MTALPTQPPCLDDAVAALRALERERQRAADDVAALKSRLGLALSRHTVLVARCRAARAALDERYRTLVDADE